MEHSGPSGRGGDASALLAPAGDASQVAALRGVLDGTQPVEIYRQPIVDLSRGVTAGYEALARFPGCGIAPDVLLQTAELLGRKLELEALLAERALPLSESLPPNCFLSLNIGPEFMLSPEWERMATSRASFAGVVLEITEQQAVQDYPAMRREIARLRSMGGRVAIDDTGSGYASLKHVMELRPDFIKLDRLFISGCHQEPAKRALIELLGTAADRLDAWIIAEGIETKLELEELLRLEVPLGQGYFLGRPEPQFASLERETAAVLRSRHDDMVQTRSLLRFTEGCLTALSADEAWRLLEAEPAATVAMVVDDWGRPVELIERHPLVGVRSIAMPMRVQVASCIEDVLRRALTRPAVQHFDPLAVIDEQGKLVGVARIECLTRGILETADSEGPIVVRSYPAAMMQAGKYGRTLVS